MMNETKKAIETIAAKFIKARKERFPGIEEKMETEEFLSRCFYEHLQNEYDYDEEFDISKAVEGELVDFDIEYDNEIIQEIVSLFDKYDVNEISEDMM